MSFERKELGNGAFALISSLLADEGFLAAFTERSGGVSTGEFESLNLSYSSGDDPSRIALNRSHVIGALEIPPFALGGQVHGASLIEVDEALAASGYTGPEGVLAGNDGLHTVVAGIPVAVATADCVPLILASAKEGRVAAVHAGWRGISAGIVAGGVSLFEDASSVTAAVGPAAGPCHYEVGPEVLEALDEAVPGGAIARRDEDSLHVDLGGSIDRVLRGAGVQHVDVAELCTIHERQRFFSHRRDGPCGRQMAIAMRRAN